MKLLAALIILAVTAAGWPVTTGWLKPPARTLAPSSRSVQTVTARQEPPQLTGREQLSLDDAYAVDAETMTPLFAANANRQVPIASLTKLMTSIVALHDLRPEQTVTVGRLPSYDPEDSIIGLKAGERFKVQALLQATLIQSADDAADALAIADAGTQSKFIAKMNRFAAVYGLHHTRFNSTSGLNDDGNYSSAHDLAILGKIAMSSANLRAVAATPSTVIRDQAGRSFALATTDNLLASGQFSGIKTGYTQAAGQCFVGLTLVQGHPVITVVLDSADRFGDTESLRDWIERNWQWPTAKQPLTP